MLGISFPALEDLTIRSIMTILDDDRFLALG